MKVKGDFFVELLWKGVRLGDTTSYQYPSLHSIAQRNEASVTSVLEDAPLNIAFRRLLIRNNGHVGGT
jgi:hypothetical protein